MKGSDRGFPTYTTDPVANVIIDVIHNDRPPVFDRLNYVVDILETQNVFTSVIDVAAPDDDPVSK